MPKTFLFGGEGGMEKKQNKNPPKTFPIQRSSVYPALLMFVKSVARNPTIPKGNTLIHMMLNLISYTYYSN